jgi:hypothetical protein
MYATARKCWHINGILEELLPSQKIRSGIHAIIVFDGNQSGGDGSAGRMHTSDYCAPATLIFTDFCIEC